MVIISIMLRLANTEFMEMLRTSGNGSTTRFLIMVGLSTARVSKIFSYIGSFKTFKLVANTAVYLLLCLSVCPKFSRIINKNLY
jgi:ABC-type lipopolysaccharide export system ATPase subunit